MTTTAAQVPGNPIKNLVQSPDPKSNSAVTEPPKKSPPSDGGAKEQAKLDPPVADGGSKETDIQKKMKRAERFGTTVQLSEEEKRSTRAERYFCCMF